MAKVVEDANNSRVGKLLNGLSGEEAFDRLIVPTTEKDTSFQKDFNRVLIIPKNENRPDAALKFPLTGSLAPFKMLTGIFTDLNMGYNERFLRKGYKINAYNLISDMEAILSENEEAVDSAISEKEVNEYICTMLDVLEATLTKAFDHVKTLGATI